MLFWILWIIATVVVLRYVYLTVKRVVLILKINQKVKQNNGKVWYCRNPFISIFLHDGKTDLTIYYRQKAIDVSIVTTPLRFVRYHFDISSKLLELIIERRAMYVTNHKVPNGFSSMDRVYTIWKYKFDFEAIKSKKPKFVILNPAPRSISKAEGANLSVLENNDTLIDGVKVCGLKWFVENII